MVTRILIGEHRHFDGRRGPAHDQRALRETSKTSKAAKAWITLGET
jgi:hypothetical protein